MLFCSCFLKYYIFPKWIGINHLKWCKDFHVLGMHAPECVARFTGCCKGLRHEINAQEAEKSIGKSLLSALNAGETRNRGEIWKKTISTYERFGPASGIKEGLRLMLSHRQTFPFASFGSPCFNYSRQLRTLEVNRQSSRENSPCSSMLSKLTGIVIADEAIISTLKVLSNTRDQIWYWLGQIKTILHRLVVCRVLLHQANVGSLLN